MILLLNFKKKKLFTSVYELSKNSNVFILHYTECNLSTEHHAGFAKCQLFSQLTWGGSQIIAQN